MANHTSVYQASDKNILELPTWRIIKCGRICNATNSIQAVQAKAGYRVSDRCNDLFIKKHFMLRCEEKDIELVNISATELGFDGGVTGKDIYNRASKHGLRLCPMEICPALRLQYETQPLGELLLIAISPVADLEGHLCILYIENSNEELWLDCGDGSPSHCWNADCRWIFARS